MPFFNPPPTIPQDQQSMFAAQPAGYFGGATNWLGSHSNMLLQAGLGLLSGHGPQEGFANAARGIAVGTEQDQTAADRKRAEADRKKLNDALAGIMADQSPNSPLSKLTGPYRDLAAADPQFGEQLIAQGMKPADVPNAFQEYQLAQKDPEFGQFLARNRPAGGIQGPPSYQWGPNGTAVFTPGGPADPATIAAQSKARATSSQTGVPLADLPVVSFNAQGQPDAEAQQQFLGQLDPATAAMVKGITSYQLDIPKVTSLRGGERERITQLASQYDPSFDMTQYGARSAMRKSMTSGTYSQAINASNLVIQHLDALKSAGKALDNSSFTPYNTAANTYKTMTGDPAVTNFNTVADAAASELAKVFKGSGASSEEEIKSWRANLSPTMSPEQLQGAIDTAITNLLKSRLDTIHSQVQSAMGKPVDFTPLTPHSREILRKLGVDPGNLEDDAANAAPPPDQQGAPQTAGAAIPLPSGGTLAPHPDGSFIWSPGQ